MLVVADSSPLIVLVKIGHIGVLPSLFGEVVIPTEVGAELRDSKRTGEVRQWATSAPSWLVERKALTTLAIPALPSGELAAISLAQELNAELLLIDELKGRMAAAERQIPVTGTIGVLELAATRGLVDLEQAFERIQRTDFWISPELLAERLRIFLARGISEKRGT